jgi:general L-amino acid transport system substrate-binding protein
MPSANATQHIVTTALRRSTVLVLLGSQLCAAMAGTLEDVRERGSLRCGISENSPSFSTINEDGERVGIDIDHCKTISAAVFGEIKIEYVVLTPHTAFTTVQSGGVDVFCGGATWTFTRDVPMGLDATGIYFYGGQGFVTRRDANVRSVADLDGATICVVQGTTNEQNLADYFAAHELEYKSLTFSDFERGLSAYRSGRCDAFTTQRTGLAIRAMGWPDREEHLILNALISKEPQTALVRQGDDAWRDLVFWAFNARVAAEELGVSQANVEDMRAKSNNPEIQRLLGVTGNFGSELGVGNDWAYQVIRLVGNYEDIWERSFGYLGLERGPNALWTESGLMFAVPMR